MGDTKERKDAPRIRCLSKVKMFLLALTWAYISKTLSGSYMNSMLTQIERQFNIPTSLVGFINGSFEIGNLLLIIFVSYFGTKLHRPVMIGVGCVVMGLGCFLISLPHFLMDRYEYESTVSASSNWSSDGFLCVENGTQALKPTHDPSECGDEARSLLWVYVLAGNIVRGMGETPVMPLGISYIEDHARPENSPLYIGFIETGAIIGPLIGLLLASFCANIYVDAGSVNTDDLTIGPTDTRWVGAWWFGFLICAAVNILTAIPFFFLPKTLRKEGLDEEASSVTKDKEKERGAVAEASGSITKDFLPFMKSLSCNPIYMLFTLISVLQFNAFVNMFSFMPKYLEQQKGTEFFLESTVFHVTHSHAFAHRPTWLPGIPAPIYFGALVDATCLHWGTVKCGKPGACRIYDSNNFRHIYLGMPAAIRGSSFLPAFAILILLKSRQLPGENESPVTESAELKAAQRGNQGRDVAQHAKGLNDEELKTKL
ncbi:solute carrier organic anion transporter family member 1A2-like [Dipodomys merriami]|uniref:solute carrier organic anion transporter family member 1A2-like n=1 Tax=Dipodomys merriami TaxID=94247 RepID=UPI0038557AEB